MNQTKLEKLAKELNAEIYVSRRRDGVGITLSRAFFGIAEEDRVQAIFYHKLEDHFKKLLQKATAMTTEKQKENALNIQTEIAQYAAQKIYEEAEKIAGNGYSPTGIVISLSDLKQICNAVSAPKAEMSVGESEK